jgi:hypothetical protein
MIRVSVEPQRLELGRRVELVVRLTNTGAGACTNLVFSPKLPGQLLLLRGTGRIEAARVKAGESLTRELRVRPQRAGTWPLTSSNFSYQDPQGRSRRIDDWRLDIRVVPATSSEPEAGPSRPSDRGRARPARRRIFISYRREDAEMAANWLADELGQKFGRAMVFIDVHSIKPGTNFVDSISEALGSSAVVLVVIGSAWTNATDRSGRRRLDDPRDYVHLEVETALSGNTWVVPVLIDNTPMPRPEELPDRLSGLALRNAKAIRTRHFKWDVQELIADIDEHLRAGTGNGGWPP